MAKRNPHTGSRFNAFPKEEAIYGEVQSGALERALADPVAGTRSHRTFVDEAARADVAMQKSGVGYSMPDVHAYITAKVHGEPAKRPSLVRWRT